jgi:hypothetical protein
MSEQQIDLQTVLKNMREQIGLQAQEIAVLKATIEALEQGDKVE